MRVGSIWGSSTVSYITEDKFNIFLNGVAEDHS